MPRQANRQVMVWQLDTTARKGAHVPNPCRSESGSGAFRSRAFEPHPSGVECIEVTRRLSFDVGNAVKYVWRRADKGTAVQDVEKALFYLRDARTNAPQSLYVPTGAADLLDTVARVDSDPNAAAFFLGVADMDWEEAELAAQRLLTELKFATF